MQQTISNTASQNATAATCHGAPQSDTSGLPLITIVGSPNVGKSVLFNTLTGVYVTVSNYPGTTVEVTRGKGRFAGLEMGVMDTPGMYGLLPITEEERVARQILLSEHPTAIVHVVDTKNIERMLPMTLQLIEAGLPVVLVLNLLDEAERIGFSVNLQELEKALGIPVFGTALSSGRGAKELKTAIAGLLSGPSFTRPTASIVYPERIEQSITDMEASLTGSYSLSRRAVAVLLLQNDAEVAGMVRAHEPDGGARVLQLAQETQEAFNQPLSYLIVRRQRQASERILNNLITRPKTRPNTFANRLSDAMINPVTGLPLLAIALFVLYQFVGVFGAQTLVGLLEENLFGNIINPFIDRVLSSIIPWQVLRDLFGGEFGLITLGVRYAVALVLPIVGTFFLAFSVIEDSGYLPRLAMLIDRVFKKIGLNGRAVIPMVLGFGCDTMATIVTRTLETRRERMLATILLSLAIPCSAQLGVMLGLLNGNPAMLLVWTSVMTGVFLLIGWAAAKLMPGERPTFYMELPPLRLPSLQNVLVKTYTRMEWYLREVFPLFLVASLIIWVGRLTGLFDLAISALVPVVRLLGLPDQSAMAFLFGFFRRDYGAAGLYDMRATMTNGQILVSTITMTLFVPCVAQVAVTVKERGWKAALAITAFVFPFALLVGYLLHVLLTLLGVA
jgi:ferrous iron transport protein B